jgi:Restriction alleviation protein Lar
MTLHRLVDAPIDPKIVARVLPCPFCGLAPEVFRSGDGTGLMIHCITERCPNPSTSYYGDEAALAVWNQRGGKNRPQFKQTA